MKPKILVNVLFSAVIFYAAVISDGVFHGNNKKPSIISRLSRIGRRDGNSKTNEGLSIRRTSNSKTNEGLSTRRTSSKPQISTNVLRPESVTNERQSNDLGRNKGKRYGTHICHSCQPCVGGCMPHCDCDCCHHECDEGCWCPIPGAEEAPKKKPEEPCCCPCCCPCCPTPCCHHIHHHHHHCCPCCHCCNCCHCCHCCPCCCHCCHCKRSQGPLSPSFFTRPFFLYMFTPSPYFSGPYSGYGFSPFRDGLLRVN